MRRQWRSGEIIPVAKKHGKLDVLYKNRVINKELDSDLLIKP